MTRSPTSSLARTSRTRSSKRPEFGKIKLYRNSGSNLPLLGLFGRGQKRNCFSVHKDGGVFGIRCIGPKESRREG